MKYSILATILLLASSFSAWGGTVQLIPSSTNIFAGDIFTADLVVTGNTDEIFGYGFTYSLSNSNVQVSSLVPNAFFGSDFGFVTPGLSVYTSSLTGLTASTVTLATFTFIAPTAGLSLLTVAADLGDLNQGLFVLSVPGGLANTLALGAILSLNVQDVPEPATFGFSAMALAALLAVGRRRLSQL